MKRGEQTIRGRGGIIVMKTIFMGVAAVQCIHANECYKKYMYICMNETYMYMCKCIWYNHYICTVQEQSCV